MFWRIFETDCNMFDSTTWSDINVSRKYLENGTVQIFPYVPRIINNK